MIDEIIKEVLGELSDDLIMELSSDYKTKDTETLIKEYLELAFKYGYENRTEKLILELNKEIK